jgi:site-specific DNA recombinase
MGYEVILEELLDTTKLEKKAAVIQNEMEIVEELFRKMVDENSRKAMDQKEYSKKYNELVERYKKAQDELNEIEEKQQENKVRKDSIDTFIDRLKSQDTILTDFDEALWTSTIEKVVIEDDNNMIFHFRDGTKIKQEIYKNKFTKTLNFYNYLDDICIVGDGK